MSKIVGEPIVVKTGQLWLAPHCDDPDDEEDVSSMVILHERTSNGRAWFRVHVVYSWGVECPTTWHESAFARFRHYTVIEADECV